MQSLIHADIFFFVTTIVVIILGILIAVILYYIARIARNVDYVSQKIRRESDNVSEDLADFRARFREEGMKVIPWTAFISKFIFGRKNHRRKHTKDETSEE